MKKWLIWLLTPAPRRDAWTGEIHQRAPFDGRSWLNLPLVTKELIEQSARVRTYIIRVVYALLIYTAAFVMFSQVIAEQSESALSVLGRGRIMFASLMQIQLVGIYFFMPALTCGAISLEKERNTLGLLILTRLGPWTILIEKLMSRVVPLWTLLLLCFPLMAFAYSMGGITQGQFWASCFLLAMFGVQIGAFSLMCSAYCRTAGGALLMSYLLGFVAQIYPPGIGWLVFWMQEFTHPLALLVLSGGSMFWTFIFLVLARDFVFRRAFLPPSAAPRLVRQEVDHLWDRFGLTGGDDLFSLPRDQPIAWREAAKNPLFQPRLLLVALIVIELPLCGLLGLIGPYAFRLDRTPSEALFWVGTLAVVYGLGWLVSLLMLCVVGTSLLVAERATQTLDILLTTPISAREILVQKMRGLHRLRWALSVPLATLILARFVGALTAGLSETDALLSMALDAGSLVVYLSLATWYSVWLALIVRTQMRAILWCVGGVGAWLVLPLLTLSIGLLREHPAGDLIRYLSPIGMLFREFALSGEEMILIANILVHLGAWWALRHYCLSKAERLLRGPEPLKDDTAPPPGVEEVRTA